MHKGWHSRGYLPHFDSPELIQFLTFRMGDSLPLELLKRWRSDPQCWSEHQIQNSIQNYLDRGKGACHLNNPEVAAIVQNSLLHFDQQRYRLLAWCVMPNHVHTLVEGFSDFPMSEVLHSWKSFTALKINAMLGLSGTFWQIESFDRYIRDENHFQRTLNYIEQNPVKAGLCEKSTDWAYGSAGFKPAV
ncbi:transposase [bacterium]|nr:MAG: transposase [bacterium]